MSYETIIVERRGPVGWLILNRPESLNARNLTMHRELPQAWAELDTDDDVRVIVMTGRGRGFSAGADVKEVAASGGGMKERISPMSDGSTPLPTTARDCHVSKPVIVAVNGVCAGAGLHFLADADIVITVSSATFLDPHVSVGQTAALEPISLLGTMPRGSILRMALVGSHERLSAEDALRLGLVTEIVDPPERLEEAAQALAEKIARNSPAALRSTKQVIWGALEVGRAEALERGWRTVVEMWGHPDNAEGPRAIVERRTPAWAPPSWKASGSAGGASTT